MGRFGVGAVYVWCVGFHGEESTRARIFSMHEQACDWACVCVCICVMTHVSESVRMEGCNSGYIGVNVCAWVCTRARCVAFKFLCRPIKLFCLFLNIVVDFL